MPAEAWRERAWSTIDQPWDVVVIGGGITGAGIFREAVRGGLRALLVEQRDFAWGASSRSSKLVHGGFRYLSQGRLRLVRDAVRQRRKLLTDAPGLVAPIGFMLASYKGDRPAPFVNRLAVALYDLLAFQWNHQRYDPATFALLAPHVTQKDLVMGLRSVEGTTDDARLVLRVIREAVAAGGVALNYVAATALLREDGLVVGVSLRDVVADRVANVRARVVVNATGAWVDRMREQRDGPPHVRPLRGSHLVFPAWRLPVAQVIAFRHPLDGRYVSVGPWEGVTLVGTTDLDHRQPLEDEPAITGDECAYLMAGVDAMFPSLGLTLDDVISSFSGVRPVIASGQGAPSEEVRDHVIFDEQGLVTVMGGKLTTFHVVAQEALAAIRSRLPGLPEPDRSLPALDPTPSTLDNSLPEELRTRLHGRYGPDAAALVAAAELGELRPIRETPTLWAELRWAARAEGVVHLDDLLLRRVRLGLLLRRGGAELLPQIRTICQQELGWSDERWEMETHSYLNLWRTYYGLPDRRAIPDWRLMLLDTRARQQAARNHRNYIMRQRRRAAAIAGIVIGMGGLAVRWRRHSGDQSYEA